MSKYRTLGRVISTTGPKVKILLPGISTHKVFEVDPNAIPFPVSVDHRFYVHANLEAETSAELDLSDWEDGGNVTFHDYSVIVNFKARRELTSHELMLIRDNFGSRLQGYITPSLSTLIYNMVNLEFTNETKEKIIE